MKFTTITFEPITRKILLEDLFVYIFYPSENMQIDESVKFLRRYRNFIVSIEKIENANSYEIKFHFPRREILLSFRKELNSMQPKNAP